MFLNKRGVLGEPSIQCITANNLILRPSFITFDRVRLAAICLLAASLCLPIPILSLAKMVLVIVALFAIFHYRHEPPIALQHHRKIAMLVLAAFFLLCLSLLWTKVSFSEALQSISKRQRLLLIPILLLLVRSRQEAVAALLFYIAAQTFVLLSSCLLMLGIPVAWAQPQNAAWYGIFESYLAQAVMLACFFAIVITQRNLLPAVWWGPFCWTLGAIAAANVLTQNGRTGQIVLLALFVLMVFSCIPARWKKTSYLALIVGTVVAVVSIQHFNPRYTKLVSDVSAVYKKGYAGSAPDDRLRMWITTAMVIKESPVYGFGSGAWRQEYVRVESALSNRTGAKLGNPPGNPHNEYLLWGTELGLLGVCLLLAMFIRIWMAASNSSSHRLSLHCVLAGLAITCMFNSALYDAVIGDFFCVLLGLLLALDVFEQAATNSSGEASI